jgi:hypothetical protein
VGRGGGRDLRGRWRANLFRRTVEEPDPVAVRRTSISGGRRQAIGVAPFVEIRNAR